MTQIKKAFAPIVALLEDNRTALVKDILDAVKEKCSVKSKTPSTYRKDETGKVTHIFCAYYKQWFDIEVVPFGVKASTSTGYNNMCKEGAALWAKANRKLDADRKAVINSVMEGEVTPEEGKKCIAALESKKNQADDLHPKGYPSLEAALAGGSDSEADSLFEDED